MRGIVIDVCLFTQLPIYFFVFIEYILLPSLSCWTFPSSVIQYSHQAAVIIAHILHSISPGRLQLEFMTALSANHHSLLK